MSAFLGALLGGFAGYAIVTLAPRRLRFWLLCSQCDRLSFSKLERGEGLGGGKGRRCRNCGMLRTWA